MGPGFFYYHRGPDGPQIRRALLLLAISGLLAFALYAGAQMRPLLGSLATTRVSNAVNRIVYQAVNEAIDSGQIAYEQLVSYERTTRAASPWCAATWRPLTGCNPRSWI